MTAKAAERAALSRRWEQATEWPLMVAAVAFLAAYAVPILDPGLPSWLLEMCRWLSWITWGIFVVRLSLGRRAAPVPRPALVRRTRDSPSPTPAAAPAPVDPTTLGAESTGQVATARPGGDLRSRGCRHAGSLRLSGGARCRAVESRRQHHRFRRCELVGGYDDDNRWLRRPLPSNWRRASGGLWPDGRRHRATGHCDRDLGVVVS
jgi:hypothetical protein